MRMRMRRRYREGVQLSKRDFGDQPWECGMLSLESREGRDRLGLWPAATPDVNRKPLGLLWPPEIAACAYDTISFAGAEKLGERWFYRVWFCEVGSAPPD